MKAQPSGKLASGKLASGKLASGQLALSAGLLAVLSIVPAVLHGRFTNRWGAPFDRQSAARRVEAFPREFAGWRLDEQQELAPQVQNELQCEGYFSRKYLHARTGEQVWVILMVGPPGPMVRHPPEICYVNRENVLVQEPQVVQLQEAADRKHDFRVLRFRSPGVAAGEFSVCYAWSSGSAWQVPDFPRLEFGGKPLLYKLQLMSTDPTVASGESPAIWSNFLRDFLPIAHGRVLTP